MSEKLNFGNRSKTARIGAVVGALVRRASDRVAATAMRFHGPGTQHTPPEELVAEWRAAAGMDALPPQLELDALCASTLAGWHALSLSDRILLLDAWGIIQQKQPHRSLFLPRPLLRCTEATVWAERGAASVFELNLCAVRADPFLATSAADLARSILDGAIHACAQRVRGDYRLAAAMGPLLSMAVHASRTRGVQAELHLVRSAAADAVNPVEEAIYQRIAWTKNAFACDSFTARSHVATSLARDSVQAHGGNLRATFVKAFGCAPDELLAAQTPPGNHAVEAAEGALEAWRFKETSKLVAAAALAEAEVLKAARDVPVPLFGVHPTELSVTTVHSDGRALSPAPSP